MSKILRKFSSVLLSLLMILNALAPISLASAENSGGGRLERTISEPTETSNKTTETSLDTDIRSGTNKDDTTNVSNDEKSDGETHSDKKTSIEEKEKAANKKLRIATYASETQTAKLTINWKGEGIGTETEIKNRPKNIVVKLYSSSDDGRTWQEYVYGNATIESGKGSTTTYEWRNLPAKNKDGKNLTYRAEVATNFDHYTSTSLEAKYTKDRIGNITHVYFVINNVYKGNWNNKKNSLNTNLGLENVILSNQLKSSETGIKVKKIWENEKGFEIDAPEEKIEVELYKNGVTTGEKLKLTKENNWIGVFDVSGTNDELAEYSVKEIGESKHSVLINDNRYRVTYGGDAKNGFVVTNKVSKGIVSNAKIPFGKKIILPTVSPEKEKENLLELMNNQPDSWTFKYKLEELKDKDTVIKTYDFITLTVENLVKTNKQDFYDDLSYYLDREVTSLDDLNNQEISRAYTLARQYLLSGYGYAEFYLEDKKIEEIDGYTEDYLFRVTELPSEYSDIVDDQYNERYYYVKTTIEDDGTYQTYWNCAESYEKLDREDNAQNRQDNLFEIFKSFTGEDLKEYMGYDTTSVRQAQSLPSRCAFYNKLKKAEDKKISIPVKKIWKNTDGTEIDSVEEKVEVELYKDGKATGKVVTLNDANEWTASFGQIEDTENSSVSKYTVKEIGEKDGRIEITNDAFSVSYSGDIENGFTVENKYISGEDVFVPVGKHMILPKGTIEQKRQNLLYLVNGPDDEWNFTYKIEKLKDKDTVEHEYDPVTITIPNIIKNYKDDFYKDVSQKIGRNISAIDQLNDDEIETAYYIAREKLFRVRQGENNQIKIELNVDGEGEAIFRVTENPSNYANILDDKNNERYHYYKAYKDENGEIDIYWNFANSYDKLDRNNKNYLEEYEYEKLFEEAVGETYFEYIGQSNNYSSRDNIVMALMSSFYNTIKSTTPPRPLDPPKEDIKVEKIWKDKDGKEISAPVDKIEVELYRDGEKTDKKIELNKSNNWRGEFKDLDTLEKVDSEKAYEYTIKEVGEETGKITIGKNKYQVSYDGSMEKGFKVTNKKEVPETPDEPEDPDKPLTPLTPSKADIKVEKIWEDKDGKEITAPEEKIEVELYQDGKATGKKLELNKDNDWKAEFKDLDTLEKVDSEKAYEYTIKEVGEETGKITIGKNKYQVSYDGSMEKGFKVTNKKEVPETPDEPEDPDKPLTPLTPSKADIKVEKIWEDKDGKEITAPEEKIEVELYQDGKATGKKLELNKDNDWKAEFKDLDTLEKVDSEKAYEYTIKEVGEETGKITIGKNKYQVSYDGSMEKGFKVTNKKEVPETPDEPEDPDKPLTPLTPSKADIKVEKIWEDKDGKEITAPEEKIEVELYQDGKATGKKLELNKDNDWKAEFKDLDTLEKVDSEKAYEYTIKEVGEETGKITIGKNKYQVSYDGSMEKGFKVTNKKEVSKTPDKPGEPGKPSKPNIPITSRVPNKPNTPIKSKGLDKFGKSNSPKTGINGLGNVLATAFTAAIALFASRNKKED